MIVSHIEAEPFEAGQEPAVDQEVIVLGGFMRGKRGKVKSVSEWPGGDRVACLNIDGVTCWLGIPALGHITVDRAW